MNKSEDSGMEDFRPGIFREEWKAILRYWMRHSVDQKNGGFAGRIDGRNIVHPEAPRGIVLYSRILWAFSAAWIADSRPEFREMAGRAYQYILAHFNDPVFGGLFWSVDNLGRPLDDRKQAYGTAFCLYGMAEYYRAFRNPAALHYAKELYGLLQEHHYDPVRGGYIEAFTRDWQDPADRRISEKDANEAKTANTHLHILEAYSALFTVWPDAGLHANLKELIIVFHKYFIDPATCHLRLFMDEEWVPKSDRVSYGHDIEASWLLTEAASLVGDEQLSRATVRVSLRIAEAAAEGWAGDGSMYNESRGAGSSLNRERHWWIQAEAMVGFMNAWQWSGESSFLEKSKALWTFIRDHLIDRDDGEWFWGLSDNYKIMVGEDKAGFWKCPYHNSRACLEMIKRLSTGRVNEKLKDASQPPADESNSENVYPQRQQGHEFRRSKK